MRAGAPSRRGGAQTGSMPTWAGDEDRLQALAELELDYHAASTRGSNESRLRHLHRALDGWGLEPFPPSLQKVRAYAATLKRGKYRSAASYLWVYKGEAERRGFLWDSVLLMGGPRWSAQL